MPTGSGRAGLPGRSPPSSDGRSPPSRGSSSATPARTGVTARTPAQALAAGRRARPRPRLFEREADLDGSVARLRALPGVGEWTAQYIAMRAMREPDAFPATDVGLLRAMAGQHGRPSADALLQYAGGWRPWRAYAALHLWTADPGAESHAVSEVPNAIAA